MYRMERKHNCCSAGWANDKCHHVLFSGSKTRKVLSTNTYKLIRSIRLYKPNAKQCPAIYRRIPTKKEAGKTEYIKQPDTIVHSV